MIDSGGLLAIGWVDLWVENPILRLCIPGATVLHFCPVVTYRPSSVMSMVNNLLLFFSYSVWGFERIFKFYSIHCILHLACLNNNIIVTELANSVGRTYV